MTLHLVILLILESTVTAGLPHITMKTPTTTYAAPKESVNPFDKTSQEKYENFKNSPVQDWRSTLLEWLSSTRDLDLDLGLGHTAYRCCPVTQRLAKQLSRKILRLETVQLIQTKRIIFLFSCLTNC